MNFPRIIEHVRFTPISECPSPYTPLSHGGRKFSARVGSTLYQVTRGGEYLLRGLSIKYSLLVTGTGIDLGASTLLEGSPRTPR